MYSFNTFFGCLLKQHLPQKVEVKLPENAAKGLKFVNNPFLLQSQQAVNYKYNCFAKLYAIFLVTLCKKTFWIAYYFSKIRFPIFKNAEESLTFFRTLYSAKEQKDLCLPRSLFVAATSRQFTKNGYMFIGVFLPTTQMHAWVIENNTQPDVSDNIWTLYKPVAVICRK